MVAHSLFGYPSSTSPAATPEDSIYYYLIGTPHGRLIKKFVVALFGFLPSLMKELGRVVSKPVFSAPQKYSLLAFFPQPYYAQAQQLGCKSTAVTEVR